MLRDRSGSRLYVRHGYVRRRLASVGLLVSLTSKTLFNTSIHGIILSIDAVDSALMLWVAPTKIAFSTTGSLSRGSFNGRSHPELNNCHKYGSVPWLR